MATKRSEKEVVIGAGENGELDISPSFRVRSFVLYINVYGDIASKVKQLLTKRTKEMELVAGQIGARFEVQRDRCFMMFESAVANARKSVLRQVVTAQVAPGIKNPEAQ